METPTVVRTTKNYMLIKVPLPSRTRFETGPVRRIGKLNRAEKRLWRIIQEGEREYREGKTIAARSIDEALKLYERRKDRAH